MLIEQNIFEVCCFYTFCITYLVPNVEIAFERIHVKIKLLFLFPPSHVMHGTHVNVLYYFTLKRMLRLLVNITLYSYQDRLWNQCPPHSFSFVWCCFLSHFNKMHACGIVLLAFDLFLLQSFSLVWLVLVQSAAEI